MTNVPSTPSLSPFASHCDWAGEPTTTDAPEPTSTVNPPSVFTSATERGAARPPFLSAFGLGERHSRCSTPSARNESNTSHESSFLKPQVKMVRPNELKTASSAPRSATDATLEDDDTAKSSLQGRTSRSRTPLTATSSDVLNRSDSSQLMVPDIPQWLLPSSSTQTEATTESKALPLPRVVPCAPPLQDTLSDSMGAVFGSSESLGSTAGTSLSRCRRKLKSLTCPAFDLSCIEKQQDRDPSFLSEVCNAAECHPISEISSLLCLGTWKDAGDEALLRRYRIKYVLNVAKELHGEDGAVRPPTPEGEKGEFISHSIPMRDCHHEKLTQNFDDAFEFIERARLEHARVLVHCRRGISRSAAIVVAYLMASEGLRYHDAYELVRSRRSCVSLNLAFQEVLSEYVPDPRWRHTEKAGPLQLDAPKVVSPNLDEENQGYGESPQADGDDSSRDSFNDDVMLLDEETAPATAPFSPLVARKSPRCFTSTFDEPSSPSGAGRGSHLTTPFGAHVSKLQNPPTLSPFA